jgi:hypothetical protein
LPAEIPTALPARTAPVLTMVPIKASSNPVCFWVVDLAFGRELGRVAIRFVFCNEKILFPTW